MIRRLALAACLLLCAPPAHGQAVYPYQKQPVHRIVHPLERGIFTEMDRALQSLALAVNSTLTPGTGGSGGGFGASFSDALFYLYDNGDANKKLYFQLSGQTTLIPAIIAFPQPLAPSGTGNVALLENVSPFTRTQTFTPDRDEDAIVIDGTSVATAGNLLEVLASGTTEVLTVSAGGNTSIQGLTLNAGTFGVDPHVTLNPSGVTNNRDFAFPDVSGTGLVRTAGAVSARVIFYTGSAGAVTSDADMTFAADSLIATKVRAATSIRVGASQTVSELNHGNWTPTRSAEANLDANVTTFSGQFMRVGNVVTVSGRFTVDPTTTLTATSFEFSLPVASNFGAVEDAAGVAFCGTNAGEGVQISASVANNTLVFAWTPVAVTSQTFSFTATYEVL